MISRTLTALLPSLVLAAACGGNLHVGDPVFGLQDASAPLSPPLRPYRLVVPKGYDGIAALPLVVQFHGYGSRGAGPTSRMAVAANAHGFLLATPDGTVNSMNRRFWNATDACCNFDQAPVDDVAYFNAIVDDVQRRYRVDPRRVFAVGASNGGFMVHRLACDASTRIAGIVSLAGASWVARERCSPVEPVAVLQVHGDADTVIRYGGGRVDPAWPPYPGARETVEGWAARNGCQPGLRRSETMLDIDTSRAGAETTVDRLEGCRGGAAELWTIGGGSHGPALAPSWEAKIYRFLMDHPKP